MSGLLWIGVALMKSGVYLDQPLQIFTGLLTVAMSLLSVSLILVVSYRYRIHTHGRETLALAGFLWVILLPLPFFEFVWFFAPAFALTVAVTVICLFRRVQNRALSTSG
jgi:hypothetical protein